MPFFVRLTGVFALVFLSSCNNAQIQAEQQVNLAFGNIQSQYQRRADLVPNLVSTVKAAADHEKSVLEAVTQARATASQTRLDVGDLSDPAKMAAFQKAQTTLSSSLQRLIATAEAYPQLQANQGFRDLQVQLEGTENRIARARDEYNRAVAEYNNSILTWPGRIWAGDRRPKEVFQAEAGSQEAPKVKF